MVEAQSLGGALLVALGAAPGACLRWWLVRRWSPHWAGRHQRRHLPGTAGTPWATMAVNGMASGVLGVLVGVLAARPQEEVWLWLGVGFAGSLSTFSTLMVDMALLLRTGHRQEALGLAGASVVVGYSLLALGLALGGVLAP
ncbi:fluoride efflux transporter FluC [Candidatus Synechococcus spongiarum]|uniref:Fluoride-specific ion channel FluC n=1 Tax=Candidatus Synechococcus spongiarum TaxID=431041 RepID=A0A171DGV0_9SYNE|nr:CrcB family protein [Candidatus Synechococcus spongiarum]SAY38971.1 CrcB protein [Candidatus Synechococcus spongiarum]